MSFKTDLGFYPQKELRYTKLLPFKDQLEEELVVWLVKIKENLGRAVMLREIEPACVFWTRQLYTYIEIYGLKFSKEDHIIFVKLMYEIVTIPRVNATVMMECSNVLRVLLKKKELIRPDELELSWRPFYKMICTFTERGTYKYSLELNTFLDDISYVKTYFSLSATQEILDELRPTFCPFNVAMKNSLYVLSILLPTNLRPQHHSVGYLLWFDELMNMWKVFHNAYYWEPNILYLMGRLARDNIGYIDWNPHLPVMFSRFIRYLNLPVMYKNASDNRKSTFYILPICSWIVGALGNGSDAQKYLNKFLKTIETYIYPANYGQWTKKLTKFLFTLTDDFLIRLRKERYNKPTWETSIPDNYKLTDDDIDAFVKSVLPLAMVVIYHEETFTTEYTTLQNLALLRPNLVIPDVVKEMYSTFNSSIEPHKLITSIKCMTFVAHQMVQGSRYMNGDHAFPEGPTHVIPLLFRSLPGIDANDLKKCYVTLTFIGVYCELISLVDCSQCTTDNTIEETVCKDTSRFEDFVLQFLDKVFELIGNLSFENDSKDGKTDEFHSSFRLLVTHTCEIVLSNSSKTIFDSALNKLRTFMTERISEIKIAGHLAQAMFRGFAICNGRETLRVLFPTLSQTILSLVNEIEDVSKEYNLDQRLLYTLLILTAVVDTTGDNLLPYMDTLYKIFDRILILRPTDENTAARKLLQKILSNLSTITMYPEKVIREDPNYFHVRDWGKGVDVDNFDPKWYIPGAEELAAVKKIFLRYLIVHTDKLKKYCEDPSILTSEELCISLNIIGDTLFGAVAVLPVWSETPLALIESSVECNISVPRHFDQTEFVTMPDGSNVRQHLAGIMSQVQRTMFDNGEDDTKSFIGLGFIWQNLLFGNVDYIHDVENNFLTVFHIKKMFENKVDGKKNRIRRLLRNRCLAQLHIRELARIKNSCILTETHKQIMMEIFTLATSKYKEVRCRAQFDVYDAITFFSYSFKLFAPYMFDILTKDIEKYHTEYKGVLYILLRMMHSDRVRENWNLLKLLLPAVVLSQPSEKESLIQLKTSITNYMSSNFGTCTIELKVPDRCLTVARTLWKHCSHPMLPQPDENMIEMGVQNLKKLNESNLAAYNSLRDELLRCISQECLHWRHRLMAMSFIYDIRHPDQHYPAQAARYFLQALIHDSVEERQIATKIVACMLKQQQRKRKKVKVNLHKLSKKKRNTLSKEQQSQPVTCGIRPDNIWLQYNDKTRPLTAEQWDEPRYVHQEYTGYYVWPKVLKVDAPSSKQPCLDPATRELTDCEKEVHLFFDNPKNVENLINYFSEDDVVKFDLYRYFLFKCLFCNHGIVHLKHFLPHLQRLVKNYHESSQRCAAEIIGGLIKGAKHWPFQMTCDMWQAIVPIIRTAITNATRDTITNWNKCFSKSQKDIDPNRSHWLFECLMEEETFLEETSFTQTTRLDILQSILNQAPWRKTELLGRLVTRLENQMLTNSLQSVRETLGSMLVGIFSVDLKISRNSFDSITPRIQTLINKILPHLNQLITNDNADKSENLDKTTDIVDNVTNVTLDASNQISLKNEISKGMLKIVCTWIQCNFFQILYCAMPEFYQLFPIICELGTSKNDEELYDLCLTALGALAQALVLPEDMSTILTTVKTTSEHLSWSVRLDCLAYLQVLVFHNMSIILSDNTWIDCVTNIVLCLLEDDHLEVREQASKVLSGLIHCTCITDYEKLLEEFKRKTKTRLYDKKKPCEDVSGIATSAIRLRHAGVLGLCAFITAHPYDVPKYVPSIVEHLNCHMNDPQPIPTTIRKTLEDFKRTHFETSAGIEHCAQHFTDDQWDILQNITISLSYYA